MHIWARIAGNGIIITPSGPFEYRNDGQSIHLICFQENTSKSARISFSTNSSFFVQLDQKTHNISEIARTEEFPDAKGPLNIQTGRFQLLWPTDWTLISNDEPPGFALIHGADAMLFAQGPSNDPMPEDLSQVTAPGQQEITRGKLNEINWIDVEYDQSGQRWEQRKYATPITSGSWILFTAQFTSDRRSEVIPAADAAALSIRATLSL